MTCVQEFAASQTPSWFSALPTDVQQDLLAEDETTSSSGAPCVSDATGTAVLGSQVSGSLSGLGGFAVPTTAGPNTGDYSSSSIVTAKTTGAGSIGSTGAGAAMVTLPTGIVGAGLAGVLGLAGIMAL